MKLQDYKLRDFFLGGGIFRYNNISDMKMNYLWGIVTLMLAVSCTPSHQNRFQLDIQISEAPSGEFVFLAYPVNRKGTWYVQTDSARLVDGKIRFEGEIPGITPAYLSFENMDEVVLYLVPDKMHLRMNRSHPYDFTGLEGSLMKEIGDYRAQLGAVPQRLCEKNRRAIGLNERWLQASSENRDSLWRQFMQAVQEFKLEQAVEDSLRMAFITQHPDYAIAPHLLYLSTRVNRHEPQELKALYDRIPTTDGNRIMRELAEIQLAFVTGDSGFEVGMPGYDFTRTDASGNLVRLSDYVGKSVVLLDFWASWCGPCLKAAPAIHEAARKYADRGLQVIGLSVDDDPQAWRKALTEHGLDYCPQVLSCESVNSDVLYFPEQADLADLYQVTQIPCLILIDRDGRIAARWQRITPTEEAQLEEMLN